MKTKLIEQITQVRQALSDLESDILKSEGVGLSLPVFEVKVNCLGDMVRDYQKSRTLPHSARGCELG